MTPSQIIAERYELMEMIDEGGMGQVFRARDTQTSEIVAIKVLKEQVVAQDPTLVERFCREAVVLRKLNHPNIIRVYDTFEEDGRNYIVMEYISHGSLAQRIQKEGALPVERAVQVALDLADALTRTHRLGVIHRDLKPGNVLMADDHSPRLTDFGVAHLADAQTLMTQVGSLLGTIAYLSPEVTEGESHSEKSDIWAFGLIIYEMLTGKRVFNEATPANMLTAILRKPIPDLRSECPQAPEDLVQLVEHMLEKDPDDRIASAREVGVELERILQQVKRDAAATPSRFTLTPEHPLPKVPSDTPDNTTEVPPLKTRTTATASITPLPVVRLNAPSPARQVTNPRIFIAYRREDSGEIAGRLYDQLSAQLGETSVVRDVDRITDRTVSRYVLANDVVGSVDVMLVLVGTSWVGMTRDKRLPSFTRSIDSPKDVLRMQIEAGLRRPEMLMIPVFVNGGVFPADLPVPIESIRTQEGFTIAPEQPLEPQVKRLVRTINDHFGLTQRERSPLIWLAVIAFVLALAVMGAFLVNTVVQGNASTPTAAPLFPALTASEYRVVVADLEALRATPRDVSRFVIDDLKRRFETEMSNAFISVEHYPQVITSTEQADAIAQASQASIIVWGNYSEDVVDLQVQAGSLVGFEGVTLNRSSIDQLATVRVRLTDERLQSIAPRVQTVLALLYNAEGDGYGLLRTLTELEAMDMATGEIVGNSLAAQTHRVLDAVVSDNQTALDLLNQTIDREGGNPILYIFRALVRQRIGDFAGSGQDIGTAQRLAPAGWLQPEYLLANAATFRGNFAGAIVHYDRIIAGRPDDWFPLNYRGALKYVLGDYEGARLDLEASIALGPDANFPYPFATLIALRQGRIDDARALMGTVLRDFPDPTLANRSLRALYGDDDAIIWGPFFAAFTNLILGQYNSVIQETDRALVLRNDLADLYMLRGLAQCNLDQYAEAEASYSAGLTAEPSHVLLYIFRAEVRRNQAKNALALADLSTAHSLPNSDAYTELLTTTTNEPLTCKNFISVLIADGG